jgi:hypothetical protein
MPNKHGEECVSYLIKNTGPAAAHKIYHISSKKLCGISKARNVSYLIKNTAPAAAHKIYHISSKNLRRIGKARNLSYLIKNIAPAAASNIYYISSKNLHRIISYQTYCPSSSLQNLSYFIKKLREHLGQWGGVKSRKV